MGEEPGAAGRTQPGAGGTGSGPGRPGSSAGGPTPAPGTRRPPNLVGIALVATAALVAVVVTVGIFLPALGALGEAVTGHPGALPETITVCDRAWAKDPLGRLLTRDEVYERTGGDPILTEVSLFPPCPAAVDAAAPDDPIIVLFVQMEPDGFVQYTLVDQGS